MAVKSVEAFLKQNAVDTSELVKFKLTRFSEPFELRPLTQNEADAVRKANTKNIRDKRTGQMQESVDANAYSDGLIMASVVTPNLGDSSLQASYGTPGKPLDTIKAMLLTGEYTDLGLKIQEISGFETEDTDELVDEVKN